MKTVLSWSGGKDSTAMLIRALELGYEIDDIIYIDIRFNKNTGGGTSRNVRVYR